jgi:hypothetical protein
VGMLGEGEGIGDSILVLTEEREMVGLVGSARGLGDNGIGKSSGVGGGGKRECQGQCGDGVLLREPFVWPAKGSSGARRGTTGEETTGDYCFFIWAIEQRRWPR